MARAAELPQYAQIKRRLIEEIRSGQWTVGAAFPSEAELVARYRVSRSTLVRSLQELVRDGYLYRRQGQGTFVADFRHRQARAAPLPLFIHGTTPASSIRASQVLLKIMAGMESALGAGLPGVIIRQVPDGPLDDATRQLVNSLHPKVAVIVEPSFSPELMNILRAVNCTIWSMNEPVDDLNCVYIDQERAGYIATRFLLDQGRRKIALLNGPPQQYWGFAAKLRGYQRALQEAGIEPDPRRVCEGGHPIDSESGRAMLRQLLDENVAIDGVVGVSDPKALGAAALAREMGRKVPEDILVIGIDNTLAYQMDPPLPAVNMPFEEVGRQAAMRAKEAMDKSDASSDSVVALQQIRLQPTLEPRMP